MAELSQEWLSSLDNYVQGFKHEALTGLTAAVETLQEAVRDKARITPGWDEMVDNIEVWSQDGILQIGVQDRAFVSQAFALEYGDETTPPIPLLRTMSDAVAAAEETYDSHMRGMT